MSITGEPEGSPQKIGVALADILTGLYGVIAIQAALAERTRSGRGQRIDLGLLDCMVGVLANQNLNYLVTGAAPTRQGTAHPNIVPYQVFAVADGHVMLAVGNDAQFQRLCEVLSQPGLATDAKFATNAGRVMHRVALVAYLTERLRTELRDDLLRRLEARGVPAGPINTIADVFADPQVLYRGLRLELEAPWTAAGSVPGVRTPMRFSRSAVCSDRASPALGSSPTINASSHEDPWAAVDAAREQ
jgi:crotonobetainyl-CoA:carnitine CoA-transferase CaiB-like acyl-CoA transferase